MRFWKRVWDLRVGNLTKKRSFRLLRFPLSSSPPCVLYPLLVVDCATRLLKLLVHLAARDIVLMFWACSSPLRSITLLLSSPPPHRIELRLDSQYTHNEYNQCL